MAASTVPASAFFAPGLPQIVAEFAPVLVGEDPTNIEKLVEKMRWAASGAGSLGRDRLERDHRDRGRPLGSQGQVAWAAGLAASRRAVPRRGPPLRRLPRRRGTGMPLAASATGRRQAGTSRGRWLATIAVEVIVASAARAREMVDWGYTALKFDLDLPGSTFDAAAGYPLRAADIDWMVALTAALREAAGPRSTWPWTPTGATGPTTSCRSPAASRPFRLLWLEDPLPPYDEPGLALSADPHRHADRDRRESATAAGILEPDRR